MEPGDGETVRTVGNDVGARAELVGAHQAGTGNPAETLLRRAATITAGDALTGEIEGFQNEFAAPVAAV